MNRLVRSAFVFAFVLGTLCVLSSPRLAAQTSGAELRGRIADESSGVLPGVSVTVKNTETGTQATAVSGEQGQFRIPGLTPGTYEIRAELTGFSTMARRVSLVIGQVADVELTMKLGTMEETVQVTSEAPLVETSKSNMTNVVTKEQVASLPVLSRSWEELAMLTPGASQPTGTRGAFTAGGTSGRDPNVQVDGTDANDNGTGSAALQYSQEAIREFNVMTNRFSAEYGRTQSAAVNVVTKSGTNQLSGSLFSFYRNDSLDSVNYFTGTVLPYAYRQIGGSIGGPIKKDRAHFFYVLENQKQSQYGGPNTGVPIFDIQRPLATNTYMSSARIDVAPTYNHRGFIRGAWSQTRGNAVGSGKNTMQNQSGRNNDGYSVDIGENWIVSGHIVNEFRAQINRWYTGTVLNQPTGPEYNFPSAILGTGFRDPQGRWERRLEVRDDISVSAGDHSIKFGVDAFPWVRWDIYIYQYALGSFYFRTNPTNWSDMSTWPAPYQYNLGVGAFSAGGNAHVFNGYIQDDWKVQDRLTVNAGIRYDIAPGVGDPAFTIPGNKYYQPYPVDKNNFGPRIGVSYAAGAKKNTVLRGGYGMYQGQFLYNQAFYKELYNGIQNTTIQVLNPSLSDPLGGKSPQQYVALQKPGNIQIVDPNIDTPHSHQASIGFQTELPYSMGLSADFVYIKAKSQYQWRERNLNPACIDVAHGCLRPDPAYASIEAYSSPNYSLYKALLVSINRRFTRSFGFQISYTLAKSMNFADDTASSIPDPPSNPFNNSVDWGPALNDQRHLLVASMTAGLPFGVRIGTIFTAASGMPIKTVAGSDVNGDGWAAMDRPAGWSRNSLRAAGAAKLDIRVSRPISLMGNVKLEPMLEVYNALNHHNYDSATYGTSVGTKTFGLPGSSTAAFYHQRLAQLGFRVTF